MSVLEALRFFPEARADGRLEVAAAALAPFAEHAAYVRPQVRSRGRYALHVYIDSLIADAEETWAGEEGWVGRTLEENTVELDARRAAAVAEAKRRYREDAAKAGQWGKHPLVDFKSMDAVLREHYSDRRVSQIASRPPPFFGGLSKDRLTDDGMEVRFKTYVNVINTSPGFNAVTSIV